MGFQLGKGASLLAKAKALFFGVFFFPFTWFCRFS